MQLRPYQQEALKALHDYICSQQDNPCIVLPTGSGKSVVMAATVKQWKEQAPWVRGCILAHRKELVEQNAEKLQMVYPEESIGIFSAGLGKKDYDSSILFASIDSIYKRSGEFTPFDFLFIDEAHRIPPYGEGKYRTFINGCKRFNKSLKVVGWTATPFRMSSGPLCHPDHILNSICYEAKITDLIAQGYLCNLRSKVGICKPDLTGVRKSSRGDYITKSLASATNKDEIISAAVAEAVQIIQRENRRSIVFFCVDVEHCKRVSTELRKHRIYAPYLTATTPQYDRDRLVQDFRAGRTKAVCNVQVLTEGFDAPIIDCVVLLRPTLSAGLFSQMVGRGLRPAPDKDCCLVLDFANCIDEHGPIDLLGENYYTIMATCQRCRESFSKAIRKCPACGWEIPKLEIKRLEQVEHERRMHGKKASDKSILSSEPEVCAVNSIMVSRHRKPGSPDSLRIQYRCGLSVFRQWICLDHEGDAGRIAQEWWSKMLGTTKRTTVDEALYDMFLSQKLENAIKTITVMRNGKYMEVIRWNQPLQEIK
jgi:DNA repair protein RadD